MAASVNDIVVDGNYNKEKLDKFAEEAKKIVELFEAGEEQCVVQGFKTRDLLPEGISIENWKTVVIFNNQFNTADEQLKCLYIGVLVSFGANSEKIDLYSKLSSKELAKIIINRDF